MKTKIIYCKLCQEKTNHMDLFDDGKMWKCMKCGEYNKPERKE